MNDIFTAQNTDESARNSHEFIKLLDHTGDEFFLDAVRQAFFSISELLRVFGKNDEVTNSYIRTDCENGKYAHAFRALGEALRDRETRGGLKEMFERATAQNDPEFLPGSKAWEKVVAPISERTLDSVAEMLVVGLTKTV